MNIAFLLTQSLQSPSGLGRYGPLSRELSKLGHTVWLKALHPDIHSLKNPNSLTDGVYIDYVAPMHISKKGSKNIYYPTSKLIRISFEASWKLSKAALVSDFDIVHVAKPHPMNSIAGLLAKYFKGSHLLLDCDDFEAGSGRFGSKWQKWIVAYFERKMPHKAYYITTNTYFMRDLMISWSVPASKIFYLPNGVERDRFNQTHPEKVKNLREELNLIGKNVVLYIGSLTLANHPVDLLLKSFILLLKEEPNTILLIVGGGADFERLQKISYDLGIANKTIFTGRIPSEVTPLYFQLADVSVDPVHNDDAAKGRCPLKMFESWAANVTFVTADVGDRRQLIGKPPAGLLSKPGDPGSLAQAILNILRKPSLKNLLCANGAKRVQEYYWDHLAKNLEEMYLMGTENISNP
jgi:glycosyltransferase involved in cell wall biosynthesis